MQSNQATNNTFKSQELPKETAVVLDLLAVERSRSSDWWSTLSQMRMQGAMPGWVLAQGIGTEGDHLRYLKAQEVVNRFLSNGKLETPDEQASLIDLLEAERTHAVSWWTILNTMRARKQLPDWARIHHIGTGPEYDLYHDECARVNRALFATEWVRAMANLEQVDIERREFRRLFAINAIPMRGAV